MIDEASAVLQLQVLVLSASSLALHTRLPKLIETEGGIRLRPPQFSAWAHHPAVRLP
ncbi:MAG: hypothetical protein MUO58_17285 [Anaerolineales bacterium]|nr:hypothetical protein [Anaerolineales bacterium]